MWLDRSLALVTILAISAVSFAGAVALAQQEPVTAPEASGETTEGGATPVEGGEPSGYSGGDYVMSTGNPGLYGEGDKIRYRRPVPEYHLVREGDTLWRLCEHYYGDPWMWPRLWARNRSISNPHWIYPGDRVRMIGGQKTVKAEDSGLMPVDRRRLGDQALVMRQDGFVDEGEREQAGQIAGSKKEALMLATFDEVYVKGGDKFQPEVGKSYTIYTIRKELRAGDKVYGHIVDVQGTLKVKRVNEQRVATAEITEAFHPIERGQLVGALRRSITRLAVRPAEVDLDARVIETFRRGKHIGTDELVFIDRGRRQGVHLGNRFLVLRRGDGYRKVIVDKERDDPSFPHEVVAEIAVLDLRDDLSVGMVTRATKELRVGEQVRLRRGY